MGNCATVTVGTVSASCVGGTLCTVPGTRDCKSDAFYWDCEDGCWKKTGISCIYRPGIAGGGTVDNPAPQPGDLDYTAPPSTVPGDIAPGETDTVLDNTLVDTGSGEGGDSLLGGMNSMMLVAGLALLVGIVLISKK